MRGILSGILMFSLCFNLSGWDTKVFNENAQKNPATKMVHIIKKTESNVKVTGKVKKQIVTNLKITVGKETFNATLYENKTTQALVALFPMTMDMSEMNGNEKYYYLTNKLPTASEKVGEISSGDLMLYGTDCLVLFYENFSSAYQYTRIGTIEDADGLAEALGDKKCKVTFDVVKNNKNKEN